MHKPVRTVAPVITPVSRTEVKAQLDVPYTDKDTLIDGLIAAATSRYDGPDGILGRCLVEQTWRQDFDAFASCLRLPFGPVISIASVTYIDAYGETQTISSSFYNLRHDDCGWYVEFLGTYTFAALADVSAAVSVTFKAGYANGGSSPNYTSTVPDGIKQMMLLLIRHWFDNPSAVVVGVQAMQMPLAVRSFEDQYVRMPV